jgi:hypothetical protein
MGAWGTGIFENDDAMDFIGDLVDGEASLDDALALGDEYVEAPDASIALAAAEVVAALAGRPSPALPKEAHDWLAAQGDLQQSALVSRALQAVDRAVSDESELVELWDEEGEDEWREPVADLRARLTSLQ